MDVDGWGMIETSKKKGMRSRELGQRGVARAGLLDEEGELALRRRDRDLRTRFYSFYSAGIRWMRYRRVALQGRSYVSQEDSWITRCGFLARLWWEEALFFFGPAASLREFEKCRMLISKRFDEPIGPVLGSI